MTYASNSSRLSDYYLVLLAGVLIGYAFIGKGFAYLGFPPIYVGEIALLIGGAIFLFLETGDVIAALTTLPSLLLAMMMAWVLVRTLPFVGVYGVDALRDSVVIMYGGFAFIVTALLLEDSRRLNIILRWYSAFLNVFILVIPFVVAISRYLGDYIPNMPGTNVHLLGLRSGEVAVLLTGATLFALVGFYKVSPLRIVFLVATMVMSSVDGRGAMLAFVIPVAFAALMLCKVRELVTVLVVGLVIFFAAYAVETRFTVYHEPDSSQDRSLSTRQILENVASVVSQAGEQAEGTKRWRLDWWDIIVKDTLHGPNFWTGRGFGLNLADADGFQVIDIDTGLPQLRSPHNVHMTMLARAGVPGLALNSNDLPPPGSADRPSGPACSCSPDVTPCPSSSMPPSMSRLRDPCRASGSGVWSVLALEQ
jgi:hypothetical protein